MPERAATAAAAKTVGTFIGLSGLNVGEKVTLWGGGVDSTNKAVVVDSTKAGTPGGLAGWTGYYTPGSSTAADGRKAVEVMGLVKQSS